METDGDFPDEANVTAPSNALVLSLRPVAPEESGDGLPYAPENWPNPGDIWSWRTGRRVTPSGYFHDRYLYLPPRLCRAENPGSSRKKHAFPSKLSVERYIKAAFPDADLNAFFSSFSWRIPSIQSASTKGHHDQRAIAAVPIQRIALAEQSSCDTQSDIIGCKAGNKMCISLILEEVEKYSPAMPCDICCSEQGFCRDCCCILCCKTVDSAYGGYSYIKCQGMVDEGICGHVAHTECALRARLAGTVGGSFGFDAEYHCRRCDARSDLISHVNKLQQTCEAIDSRDDIEKILNLGACLLRGSHKTVAKELLTRIDLAISKHYDQFDSLHQLKCGANLQHIWKVDDNVTARSEGFLDGGNAPMEVIDKESPPDVNTGTEFDSLKLENEIDQVLRDLRKSQEFEYNLAEERLHAQKNYLQNLFKQLDSGKSELACQHSSHSDALFRAVREREEQIRREVMKFKDIKMVANGFSWVSKKILKQHFGLDITD